MGYTVGYNLATSSEYQWSVTGAFSICMGETIILGEMGKDKPRESLLHHNTLAPA